jgi:CheY-like chemotaxis protein
MSTGNILIVEDTPLVRKALLERLQKEGHQVTSVGNVPQALQTIRSQMPDVIILDLTVFDDEAPLAGLSDGFAVLGLLRYNYPYANPSVIIYTADDSRTVEPRAKSMGAFAVINKSRGIQALLDAIRAAMEKRNARQAGPAATAAS